MNVVLDRARHIKIDDERHLADVAEAAAERVVHDENPLRRLASPARRSRAELGDDLLSSVLAHVLVQREGIDRASAELVRDRFDRVDGRREDDLEDGARVSCRRLTTRTAKV